MISLLRRKYSICQNASCRHTRLDHDSINLHCIKRDCTCLHFKGNP